MERKDILVVLISIAAFAVLALVVKPLLAGQSLGLPIGGQNPEGTIAPAYTIPQTTPGASTTVPPRTLPSTTPSTPTPTPTVPWDGSVKTIGFIDQPGNQVQPSPSPTIPQDVPQNRSLTTFAVISGQWSGTSEKLLIPFPSWVMEYTATPTTTSGDVFPRIIIQVFDAQNPNRGNLPIINQQVLGEPPDEPWAVKLYEGNREYYFKVDTRFIKSYTITIKVPSQYVE
jgi:hypothetical protein